MRTTARFVEAAAALPGVRLGLITAEPSESLSPTLRQNLDGHWQLKDCFNPAAIVTAVRGLATQIGPPSRLIGTLEQLQVPLAEARTALGIEGTSLRAAQNFRDKSQMKDVLRAAKLPCARHALASAPDDARRFVREVGYPIVAKPPDGAGAKATFRIDSDERLEETLRFSQPAPGRELMLEEFIVGDEFSFDTVSIRGRPVWHSVSHYVPTPLQALENPWIQWCVMVPRDVASSRYDDIRQVALRSLDALGMHTGVSHMEWFRRGDGSVAVSEVAARPPGAQICSLISYANEIDFYKAWAKLVLLDDFDPPEHRYAAGAAFLRGQGQGRVKAIHGLDEAQREYGELVVETKLPRIGQPPASGYEGEGYVIIRHPDTQVVEQALRRIVTLLRVEMG